MNGRYKELRDAHVARWPQDDARLPLAPGDVARELCAYCRAPLRHCKDCPNALALQAMRQDVQRHIEAGKGER